MFYNDDDDVAFHAKSYRTRTKAQDRGKMEHLRKDLASMAGELEDSEALNLKLKRELNEANMSSVSVAAENSRLQKTKKRLQFDFEEAVGALASERALVQELGNKLRKFAKQVTDEKAFSMQLNDQKEDALGLARAAESKLEPLEDKLHVAERQVAEMAEEVKGMKAQMNSLADKKKRTERVIEELEAFQTGLERRLMGQRDEISDLNHQNNEKIAEIRGIDLALQTTKSMADAAAAKSCEKIEVLTGKLSKVERVLQLTESELQAKADKAANEKRLADETIRGLMVDMESLKAQNGELMTSLQKLRGQRFLKDSSPEYIFDD